MSSSARQMLKKAFSMNEYRRKQGPLTKAQEARTENQWPTDQGWRRVNYHIGHMELGALCRFNPHSEDQSNMPRQCGPDRVVLNWKTAFWDLGRGEFGIFIGAARDPGVEKDPRKLSGDDSFGCFLTAHGWLAIRMSEVEVHTS